MDTQALQKELDRTKVAVFLGKNAAFFGSLACSMDLRWDDTVPTAATNGKQILWNPSWFSSLSKDERIFVYLHELWHSARLHPLRGSNKDPKQWNIACDYKINIDLVDMGYSYGSLTPYYDPALSGLSEDEIYELLVNNKIPQPQSGWMGEGTGEGDLEELNQEAKHELLSRVVQATQQAKAAQEGAGNITGGIEELLDTFLAPVIPWQTFLQRFFTDLVDEDVSWSRPNRRYQDMYLPGKVKDESRLDHLCYYMDVSGSVSSEDITRFNSEVKYIKDTYNPEKLTLVQFDTEITNQIVIEEHDQFEKIRVIGRGGTYLEPVREHIEKHKPTAAIIFSDLECPPMRQLSIDIPIIWVVINNPWATVPFGQKVHINV